MTIDTINFSIICGKESSISKRQAILQKINKEKIIKNQGKISLIINKKQKKHVKTK